MGKAVRREVWVRVPLKRFSFINAYGVASTFMGLLLDLGIDVDWMPLEKARSMSEGITMVFADAQGNVKAVWVNPRTEEELRRVRRLIKAFKALESAFT